MSDETTRDDVDGRRNNRREQLIHTAMASFRAHGPASTGIGAVCAASDVTKGVFSHHFPGGKRELTLEVIRHNAAEVDRILDHFLQACDTVGDAIVAIFDFYADLLDGDPDFGCPIAASVVDVSATHADARELASVAFMRWQDAIVAAQSERIGRPADPALGVAVVAAFEGAILLARSRHDADLLRLAAAAVRPLFVCDEDAA